MNNMTTNRDWIKIQAEYNSGKTIRQLCKEFKMSTKTIRIAKECGQFKPRSISESMIVRNKSTPRDYSHYRNTRAALVNYRVDCKFNFNLSDYPDEFNFQLIIDHGWYSAKNKGNNIYGVSRDHMLSIRYGFDNNIDPKILAHPANCKLMLHSDNASKCSRCSITLDELVDKITIWDNKYSGD